MRAASGEVRELGHDLLHEVREDQLEVVGQRIPLRLHDLDLLADRQRVVRAHLRAEAVLERRDDPATRRVVLGVRARDDEQVERQPHAITADLHVLLFHDVEQPDLDALRKVRQLVDAEDAAVGARQQAVVDRQLVREVAALGDLDRIVALVALDPRDLDLVAVLRDEVDAAPADGSVRVVVDLAARDDRHALVEQRDQRAHHPALRLPALAEHDHVVPRDDRVGELRQHRLLVADDARQERLAGAQPRQEVAAHLVLHRLALMSGGAELGDGSRFGGGHQRHYRQRADASRR